MKSQKKRRPRPKVVERKLGREKAVGQFIHEQLLIEIDPRQHSRDRLGTVVHEVLHFLFPRLPEIKIIHAERAIADALWTDRYRRIEP
jgi:hypothetical protein